MKLDGCRKRVADHLCDADGSVIDADGSDNDKSDGLKKVCGEPHGYGYFWFCEKCLKKAGKIW